MEPLIATRLRQSLQEHLEARPHRRRHPAALRQFPRTERRLDPGQSGKALRLERVVDEVIELALTLAPGGIALDSLDACIEGRGVEPARDGWREVAIANLRRSAARQRHQQESG